MQVVFAVGLMQSSDRDLNLHGKLEICASAVVFMHTHWVTVMYLPYNMTRWCQVDISTCIVYIQ